MYRGKRVQMLALVHPIHQEYKSTETTDYPLMGYIAVKAFGKKYLMCQNTT
jgi:hypothetical protein